MLQTDPTPVITNFYNILSKNISGHSQVWLDKSIKAIKESEKDKELYTKFSIAPRFVGKTKLNLQPEDLQQFNSISEGFNLSNFTTDQTARILLLLVSFKENFEDFSKKLTTILSAADIHEQIAIYSSLSLFPHPEKLAPKASEGIRTNITAVFDAIVLENPFPSKYLPDPAWNQMVLKAIFINRPLYKIYGFDNRRNADLARMLSDFAHERWAAGRTLTPELWRVFPPFLDENLYPDIEKLLKSSNILEVEAGCLVIAESNFKEGKNNLNQFIEITEKINSKELTWDSLGRKIEAS